LRKSKRLSLDQLAERAKLDRATIWRLEQGHDTNARESTIKKLARALGQEPAVLMGKVAVPEIDDDSRYEEMSKLKFRITDMAYNAMYLVADRYFVTHEDIVELAPFLFHWAAEASLQRRKARLEKARRSLEDARSAERDMLHLPDPDSASCEKFEAESESINRLDIFGSSLDEAGFGLARYEEGINNPFSLFLDQLADEMGNGAVLKHCSDWDYVDYRVCVQEAKWLCGGDEELADRVLCGHVPLSQMPDELSFRRSGDRKARIEWIRVKVDERNQRLRQRVEQSIKAEQDKKAEHDKKAEAKQ
jgi:transcriptional regulator with XRE-family HTH domain